MAKKSRKSGGDKKHGRSSAWCNAYRLRNQRERNQIKRVLRHIRRYGATDRLAVDCYNRLRFFQARLNDWDKIEYAPVPSGRHLAS